MDANFDYNETDHIVLIEDNATDVMMIKEAFKQCAIANPVFVCKDGAAAIKYLNDTDQLPGLIILDLNLPKVGGHDVLEQIKTSDRLRRLPVVIFTSSKSKKDIDRAYLLHANCYIAKPMDFHAFSQAIRTIKDFWLGLVTLPGGAF